MVRDYALRDWDQYSKVLSRDQEYTWVVWHGGDEDALCELPLSHLPISYLLRGVLPLAALHLPETTPFVRALAKELDRKQRFGRAAFPGHPDHFPETPLEQIQAIRAHPSKISPKREMEMLASMETRLQKQGSLTSAEETELYDLCCRALCDTVSFEKTSETETERLLPSVARRVLTAFCSGGDFGFTEELRSISLRQLLDLWRPFGLVYNELCWLERRGIFERVPSDKRGVWFLKEAVLRGLARIPAELTLQEYVAKYRYRPLRRPL